MSFFVPLFLEAYFSPFAIFDLLTLYRLQRAATRKKMFICNVWKPTSALFWVSDSVGLQPPTASDLRQRRTSTSDSIGPPTASDFNLRQHRTSDSVGLLSPTASDFYLRQRRTSISDSIGLLSPTASDRTTISDSVGLQSPTAS